MKNTGTSTTTRGPLAWILGLLLFLPGPSTFALPQQPGDVPTFTPGSATSTEQKQTPEQAPSAQTQEPVSAPAYSYDRPSSNIETGQALTGIVSPVHWGRLSLMSFDTMYVYDSNLMFSKDAKESAQAGAIKALIVYAAKQGRSNLTLQYQPQLWTSGNGPVFDYTSQVVDLHAFRYLGGNWGINISERFQSAPDKGNLSQVAFKPNYVNGTNQENPFLAADRRYLTNDISISTEHSLSAHDRISLTGRYEFVHLSELTSKQNQPNVILVPAQQQQDFGAEMAWTHVWSRASELTLNYAYDRNYVHGYTGVAQLHAAMLTVGRRLGRTFYLKIGAGAADLLPATPEGAVTTPAGKMTYTVDASLYKTFRRSAISIAYMRNRNFVGEISDDFNDRVASSYTLKLRKRLQVVVGGAYIRQHFSSTPNLIGKSGWVQMDYRLSRAWTLNSAYTYLNETGGVAAFGSRNLITSGIRWSWDQSR